MNCIVVRTDSENIYLLAILDLLSLSAIFDLSSERLVIHPFKLVLLINVDLKCLFSFVKVSLHNIELLCFFLKILVHDLQSCDFLVLNSDEGTI